MSDHPPAAGPPAWIDPLPDPETSDGADIESVESSLGAAAEVVPPGRPPSP